MALYLITWTTGVVTVGLPLLAGLDRVKGR
jgi:hypothetical protein